MRRPAAFFYVFHLLLAGVMILLVTGGSLAAENNSRSATASQIKAAFLYNFVKFITWPEQEKHPTNTIHLCVYGGKRGREAFFSLQGKQIKGKKIVVESFLTDDIPPHCQLLYLPATADNDTLPGAFDSVTRQVLKKVAEKPVVTVGETASFIQSGGIIRFVPAKNRIRFAINNGAARKKGITISSRLLALAEIVSSDPQQ